MNLNVKIKKAIVAILVGSFFVAQAAGCESGESGNDDLLMAMGLYLLSQPVAGTTTAVGKYKVVDTKQSTCYNSTTGAVATCSGTGYDADYTGNAPLYTSNGDKTVTDNNTGLMWTQTPDLNGDGSVNVSDKKTQTESVSYCSNLVLGGYSDWRLPDVKTLYSLMDFRGTDPSNYTGSDTSGLTPFLDSTVFQKAFGDQSAGERIIDGQYATTSIYVYYTNLGTGNTETMFGVNFVDGRIKGYPTTNKTYYVHCVRNNPDYGLNNYTDNGNETISDKATGLMWQKKDSQSTDFENAISSCESATTGGHSDWRLPDIKELNSILDYNRSPDTTGSAAIHSVFESTSITNEAGKTDFGYYWASTTHTTLDTNSTDDDGRAGSYMCFGRCPGYIDGTLYDVHGAGAQRSNYKQDVSVTPGASSASGANGTFYYHGPQGDILRKNNLVRCVRTETTL